MDGKLRRRRFLQSASALGLGAGLGDWAQPAGDHPGARRRHGGRARRGPVPARDRAGRPLDRGDARASKVLEVAVAQLKAGLSYRDLLAGLFLAGIRNIKPQPGRVQVPRGDGHQLGPPAGPDRRGRRPAPAPALGPRQLQELAGPGRQGRRLDARQGRRGHGCPSPTRRKAEFVQRDGGLGRRRGRRRRRRPLPERRARPRRWSRSGGWPSATSATSATSRSSPRRAGGPCRRSAGSTPSPSSARSPSACSTSRATPGHVAVGPYEANLENAKKIRDDWQIGKPDPAATRALLETIRQATPEDASAEAVKLLNQGVSPDSLWDAVVLAGSELLMRSPGIVAIHADDRGQRPALHLRRQRRRHDPAGSPCSRPSAGSRSIAAGPSPRRRPAIDALEADRARRLGRRGRRRDLRRRQRRTAARPPRRPSATSRAGGSTDLVFAAARRMIFHKGRDSHDYKYGAAAWEECVLASDPKWRAPLVAAAMFNLPGAKTADSPLMIRAREAVAKVMGVSVGSRGSSIGSANRDPIENRGSRR